MLLQSSVGAHTPIGFFRLPAFSLSYPTTSAFAPRDICFEINTLDGGVTFILVPCLTSYKCSCLSTPLLLVLPSIVVGFVTPF